MLKELTSTVVVIIVIIHCSQLKSGRRRFLKKEFLTTHMNVT